MNTVSVIVPIKDEEQNIGQLFERLIPVVEKPEIVQAKEKKLKNLGNKYIVINFFSII